MEYKKFNQTGLLLSVFFLILALLTVCAGCGDSGGGGGKNSTGTNLGSLLFTGTSDYTITCAGGTGQTGNGGGAGYVYFDCYGTKGVEIGTPGTIDTRFSLPEDPPQTFGTEPLVVDTDVTVTCYVDEASAEAGAGVGGYALIVNDSVLYRVVAGPGNERGGDGGAVWIYADNGGFFIHGTIHASGGNGGIIELLSLWAATQQSGTLSASGGEANTPGGNGQIYIDGVNWLQSP